MNNQLGGRPQGALGNEALNIPNDESNNNKITPELLVDALSGHEDGLLSIAEKLMTHYDSGYDAMGESIIDAFADVQKLFQHVVEAAHMEGAALERERGESEWRKRMESLGINKDDVEGVLYGQVNDDSILDGGIATNNSQDLGSFDNDNNNNNNSYPNSSPTNKEQEHRHEELIDQDVRDVLIDAIKRGQQYRDTSKFNDCRKLYETACGNASSLLPVDSDHRGRLQLAVARAESMSADRACAILKYAMDDVLRSGLTLRQGKYPQMDMNERSDCVLDRPNPLRKTLSRGYDDLGGSNNNSWGGLMNSSRGSSREVETSMVEQSAEEALQSLVEEMKEILAAPVYNLTPLQNVSEKFWLALSEAKKSNTKKEERLEQALAKIKADFLLAREEYEEQLSGERERNDVLKRRLNEMRLNASSKDQSSIEQQYHQQEDGGDDNNNIYLPQSARSEGGGYHFAMDNSATATNESFSSRYRSKHSSSQSVASMGSEFAQKAKSLVHLLNCQGNEGRREYIPADSTEDRHRRMEKEEWSGRASPR